MASFYENLFGSQPQLQQLQRFSPQQQGYLQNTLGQLPGMLQNLQKPTDISGITNNIRHNFQTQTIPSLAARFTSLGASPTGSSDFAGALGAAGAGLESQIGSLESQAAISDQQRLQQLFGLLSGQSLQPQFDYYRDQGQPGFFGGSHQPAINALSSLIPGGSFLPLLLSLFGNSGPQAQIGRQ